MNIDHSDFIARHHKTLGGRHKKTAKKELSTIVVVLIMVLYFVVMIFVANLARVDSSTILVSIFVFVMATLVAFAAKRAQYLQRHQEQELILLKEVLEGSIGGRLITDADDNTVYFNQKFTETCKPEGKESYESLIRMFPGNKEAEALIGGLSDQVHRGLSDSIELYCDRQDLEGWYQISAQPIAGHPKYIHWRIDNVTDKYTADRAIQEEREKLIDFTDNAPVGFFSVDQQGQFVFANATFARWLGEDLNMLLKGGRLHTYMDMPPREAQPYDLSEKGGDRQIAEVKMKGAGGRSFLASINQSVVRDKAGEVRTRAVVHDVTAEREMRRALQVSEDRFQRLFEEAPLGIILVNEQGQIEDYNSEFARMTGLNWEDLENLPFASLLDEEHRESVLSAIRLAADGQEMKKSMEVVLSAGMRHITTQLHARRLRETTSTVLHFIDITEKRALEAQFIQSQKMQAVGQLAGGIAHDFNNMLTAIIGFCDLLLLRHKPGDPSFGDLMKIKQSSNRAANLVRQLLAFSRQQTLRQRVHDVTDILTELSHLLRRLIGANIDLEMIHTRDLGLIKVDEGQMEQVLINLAVNARDAMEGGGKLTITTENFTSRKPRKIISEEMPPGHWVLIKVKDTGCGIPKDILGRIFEPFFTTKPVGSGTGLGLSTVYGIISQSGGYLDVESFEGKGTTFSIFLPRATKVDEVEKEPVAVTEDENARDLTGTESILLVEDEDSVRMFSQRALANKGYKVLAAESGEAAFDIFMKEKGNAVDLLITDVVMPGMDGPSLAAHIRKVSPKLKIIFMSGYSEDKLKDYMGEGIYFLPKPFTLVQLAEKVKQALAG